jgi:glycosyltransferase involved in cell wall biosynthesis
VPCFFRYSRGSESSYDDAQAASTPRTIAPHQVTSDRVVPKGMVSYSQYYPKAFRNFESAGTKIRRLLNFPPQIRNRLFWRGISNADIALAAAGDRTVRSLRAAGGPLSRIYETLDCGIPNSLSEVAYSPSRASIGRFIHFGRLVFHKWTYLAIEALAKSHRSVSLGIVGRGPELVRCKGLAKDLGVDDRVRFLDWYENRDDLNASFQSYCGIILSQSRTPMELLFKRQWLSA